jgi:hypothetical protein
VYCLYRNAVASDPPNLLVIQHPGLDHLLESRIVLPASQTPSIPGLDPPVRVAGEGYVAVLSALVAVPKRYLGVEIPCQGLDEDDVKRCLDPLLYGI